MSFEDEIVHSEVRTTSADGRVTYQAPYTSTDVIAVQNTRRRALGVKGFSGGFEGFTQSRKEKRV